MRFLFHHLVFGLLCILLLVLGSAAAPAAVLAMPQSYPSESLLRSRIAAADNSDRALDMCAVGSASSNLLPARFLDRRHYPWFEVGPDSVNAQFQLSGWVRLRLGQWIISTGRGRRDQYEGNRDAGQVWVDLHSADKFSGSYEPRVSGTHIAVSWWGLGHRFPLRKSGLSGAMELHVRCIGADDFLARTAEGKVENDSYEGMVRTLYSSDSQSRVDGRGWAIDLLANGTIRQRWTFSLQIDGLAGRMAWNGIKVDDDYVVSPRVFEDPEGFLRDYFAISGAGWRTDIGTRVSRTVRVDLATTKRGVNVLLGFLSDSAGDDALSMGLFWSRSDACLPFVRYYPAVKRLEVGAAGRNWRLLAAADDWPGSARHAVLEVGAALAF